MNNAPAYLPRTISRTLQQLSAFFPCVLITGARQVGKSTLLRHLLPEGMRYVTLDNVEPLQEPWRRRGRSGNSCATSTMQGKCRT